MRDTLKSCHLPDDAALVLPAHAEHARAVPSNARPSERAFTLIELLIVCILSTIVVAAIVSGVIAGLKGSNDAEVSRKALSQFDQARELLEKDLRAARAPGRDYDLITNRQDLRDEVQTGDSALPAGLDIEDVKVAEPGRLVFVADVLHTNPAATPQPECVTWRLSSNATSWWLERSVAPYTASCTGPPDGSYVIKPQSITAGTPAPTSVFTYVRTCDAGSCGGTATCSGSPPVGTVTGVSRNWITEVRLDLSAILSRGDQGAQGRFETSVAVRNRTSDDYMYALGCRDQS